MTDASGVQATYENYTELFGLDKPIYEQFFIYMGNVLQGDFGFSIAQYPRTVADVIASSIWWTVILQMPAIIVGWLIGNFLGAIAAYRKSGFDKVLLPASIFASSLPAFGMAVIYVYFKDSVDIYFARQQVAERLKLAEEGIPDSVTMPHGLEMGPVASGMGKIAARELAKHGATLILVDREVEGVHRRDQGAQGSQHAAQHHPEQQQHDRGQQQPLPAVRQQQPEAVLDDRRHGLGHDQTGAVGQARTAVSTASGQLGTASR